MKPFRFQDLIEAPSFQAMPTRIPRHGRAMRDTGRGRPACAGPSSTDTDTDDADRAWVDQEFEEPTFG